MRKIPSKYHVGGAVIEVRMVDRCDNNCVGEAHLCGGFIEIASVYNKGEEQSEDSKRNTFYHELVHTILDTMGHSELSQDEKFVSTFSGFLCEAMRNARFEEEKIDSHEKDR